MKKYTKIWPSEQTKRNYGKKYTGCMNSGSKKYYICIVQILKQLKNTSLLITNCNDSLLFFIVNNN